jgi:hypothetical protein
MIKLNLTNKQISFRTSLQIFLTHNFQAESRIEVLEDSVSEAQTSENQVSDLQNWIFKVDDLLNDFIEHDTTFECLPHDFQVNFMLTACVCFYIFLFIFVVILLCFGRNFISTL